MTIQDILQKDKTKIKNRIESGETTISIAKDYNCNSGTLWYFCQKNKIKLPRSINGNYGVAERNKSKIINMFGKGVSAYKISKQLNISKPVILKNLKKWGYDTSAKYKVQKGNELFKKRDLVIDLYNQGLSCRQIAKNIGHSDSAVWKLLIKEGYSPSKFKYSVNTNYFKQIDTAQKAYILGWLYSDGNIKRTGGFRISIQDRDGGILWWIREELKYNGPLYYKKVKRENHQNMAELCINYKCISEDLKQWGLGPAKTFNLKFPNIDRKFWPDFVRGYYDGDGAKNMNKESGKTRGIMIAGCYDFIYELANIIPCKITNIYQRYKKRQKLESSHQLFIGRLAEIKKLSDWLYYPGCIHLKRKRF